jgi:hypothetical protein
LSAEELAGHLNRIRTRAGNPSVRDLAKLTEHQGPGRTMSRSTIQDKISGKNPPRLWQVLALVQACADYARSIGAPLATEDTDEQIWRERAQAALVRTPPPPPPAPVDAIASRSPKFDLDPLIRAGMHDMVELVQTSEGRPMAEWFPPLIHALNLAGMSNEQFLKAASLEQPRDLVENIAALADYRHYYPEEAIDKLIYLCARNQPAESIPAIIVLLRRKGSTDLTERADQLIDKIPADRSGLLARTARNDGTCVVLALRGATLESDATRLLRRIGAHASPGYILEVASSFPDSISGDRETVLNSVAGGNRYHLKYVLKELRETALDGIDPRKTLDRIIFGIPFGQHEEIASFLESEGLGEEALRVLELKDEPPF